MNPGEFSGAAMIAVALLPLAAVAVSWFGSFGDRALILGPLTLVPALLVVTSVELTPTRQVEWFLLGGQVGLDTTGRLFLFVTSVVWLIAAVFAHTTKLEGGQPKRFFRFFYTAAAGNLLLIFAADILTFFSGFALMSYAGYGLVVHKQNRAAIEASRIYLVLVVIGEVLIVAGALLAWGLSGSWQLEAIRNGLAQQSAQATWAIGLIFLGFGAKASLIPLHIWLPKAHPAAPVAASAVLSATMIKAGLLGWLRFLPLDSPNISWLGNWAFGAGLVAAFAGVAIGVLQSKPKTILAYSSISQMGYMTMLVGMAAMVPGVYPAVLMAILVYVLHHATSKGALFLSVTVARGAPATPWWKMFEALGLVIPALALAGAPLTTGAVAKAQLTALPDISAGDLPAIFDPAIIVGAVATTVLMGRFLWVVWPRETRNHSISRVALGAWWILATSVVWGPWIVPWDYFRRAAAGIAEPYALWSSLWPMLVGLVVAVVVVRHRRLLPLRVDDAVPEGDLLIPVSAGLRWMRRGVKQWIRSSRQQARRAVLGSKLWFARRLTNVELVEQAEERIQKQAWDWVWILVVAASLFAALLW